MPLLRLLSALFVTLTGFSAETEFTPIFDGQTLTGWRAADPTYWSVEDGAITGRITPEHPCAINQYLVWDGGELADFELKLESRLNGDGAINNGFQFRSRELPDHDVCGYQVDNNLQTPWLVRLYDEYGRHDLALRGERAIFDAAGVRTASPAPEAGGEPWFKLEEWHEYHLTCVGGKITLRVNGRIAAEIEDNDPRRAEPQGILALQLHSGPPTEVQFRNIRLRVLKPASLVKMAPSPEEGKRKEILNSALAYWELDSAGRGASRKLISVPQFYQLELNVLSSGAGARTGAKCVVLDGAYFEAEPIFETNSTTFTLYARARTPEELVASPQTLISMENGGVPNAFNLAFLRDEANSASGNTAASLTFSCRTTEGRPVQLELPLEKENGGRWHDFLLRCNEKSLDVFVDSELVLSKPLPAPISLPYAPLRIGATLLDGKPSQQFRGDMEAVAIWNRTLSDEEILGLTVN